jgi:hypothetical protein
VRAINTKLYECYNCGKKCAEGECGIFSIDPRTCGELLCFLCAKDWYGQKLVELKRCILEEFGNELGNIILHSFA